MADRVPPWATPPVVRDRLYVERIPSAGAPAAERWAVDGKAAYLVGRQTEAVDIPCQHKSASRVHACLAHRGEHLFLVDLGSVHGEHCNQNAFGPPWSICSHHVNRLAPAGVIATALVPFSMLSACNCVNHHLVSVRPCLMPYGSASAAHANTIGPH